MKCQECGEDVDEIEKVKIGSRTLKLCEDCAEIKREAQEIGEATESAVQDMMGYKGRW